MTSTAAELLQASPDIPEAETVAPLLAAYVQAASTEAERAELEALILAQKPGEGAVIISRNLRNALINWRELLLAGAPAIGSVVLAYQANRLAFFLAALTAYQVWSGLFDIKLGDAHARLVRALWIDCAAEPAVPIEQLRQRLAGQVPPETVGALLDDLATLGLVEFDAGDRVIRRDQLIFK